MKYLPQGVEKHSVNQNLLKLTRTEGLYMRAICMHGQIKTNEPTRLFPLCYRNNLLELKGRIVSNMNLNMLNSVVWYVWRFESDIYTNQDRKKIQTFLKAYIYSGIDWQIKNQNIVKNRSLFNTYPSKSIP